MRWGFMNPTGNGFPVDRKVGAGESSPRPVRPPGRAGRGEWRDAGPCHSGTPDGNRPGSPGSRNGTPRNGTASVRCQMEKKRNTPRASTVTPDPTRISGTGSPTLKRNGTEVTTTPRNATNSESSRDILGLVASATAIVIVSSFSFLR